MGRKNEEQETNHFSRGCHENDNNQRDGFNFIFKKTCLQSVILWTVNTISDTAVSHLILYIFF